MSVDHLYVFFEKNVYLGPLPILNQIFLLLLSCMSSLHILNVNSLSDMICKYFLPFCRLPFHFIDGFLCAEAF